MNLYKVAKYVWVVCFLNMSHIMERKLTENNEWWILKKIEAFVKNAVRRQNNNNIWFWNARKLEQESFFSINIFYSGSKTCPPMNVKTIWIFKYGMWLFYWTDSFRNWRSQYMLHSFWAQKLTLWTRDTI